MSKIKHIKLVNYCGYKNFELDFTDGFGLRRWTILYGPNGSFKSTFLTAIDLLANPKRFLNKRNILTFRRLKHHPDYSCGSENLYENVSELKMEASFLCGCEEKRVIIEDNIKGIIYSGRDVDAEKGEISGVKLNELSPLEQGSIFIDADHGNMMHKFQIIASLEKQFCDFASSVYGFECYCPETSKVMDGDIEYLVDFVIIKPDKNDRSQKVKIHYKRMSDGEKKIATLISSLFKRAYSTSPDKESSEIILIDNIEQHIYYKRHMNLIRKMEEYFPDHQFIATTHSPVIISEMEKKYLIDME